MDLLRFLLADCYFLWSDRSYRQCAGLPMGGRLSPVLAGIFMENLEEKALLTCPIRPRLYKRFIDDIFLIWNSQEGPYDVLLDIMNDQHPDIHLTVEEEENGSIPFLDLRIQCPVTVDDVVKHPFSLSIYRKPTHGNRYINFKSAHPFALKRNVLRGLWLQANCLLKNHPKQRSLEIAYLMRTFTSEANGYPRVVIRCWLRGFQ